MTDISNKCIVSMSDAAILQQLGSYVKHHRMEQNITQATLSAYAGITRSTLVLFEKGKRSNLITFIQLLRALHLLHGLEAFKITHELSPIQLAEMEQKKRKRASKKMQKKSRNTSAHR